MDWEKIGSTLRGAVTAFRKNGREIDVRPGRNPLDDLIAKDPLPPFSEMTEMQLCEYAADHHISIESGLERLEMIEIIKESLDKNWDERLKAIRGLLDYIFADGPHPLAVIRRVYGITKAVRPQCIVNMSLADLAVLSDDGRGRSSDGRATQSARIKRIFEQPIKKAGMRGCKASFQKTDSACRNYSASAEGNKNRLGSGYLKLNGASRAGADKNGKHQQ